MFLYLTRHFLTSLINYLKFVCAIEGGIFVIELYFYVYMQLVILCVQVTVDKGGIFVIELRICVYVQLVILCVRVTVDKDKDEGKYYFYIGLESHATI